MQEEDSEQVNGREKFTTARNLTRVELPLSNAILSGTGDEFCAKIFPEGFDFLSPEGTT